MNFVAVDGSPWDKARLRAAAEKEAAAEAAVEHEAAKKAADRKASAAAAVEKAVAARRAAADKKKRKRLRKKEKVAGELNVSEPVVAETPAVEKNSAKKAAAPFEKCSGVVYTVTFSREFAKGDFHQS